MYKYKKLQTLINYIVTKHGNTPQGASKITVSLLVQEVTQRAGTGGRRPESPSPYKNPAVVIPKAMYKLHSRKRGRGRLRGAGGPSPPDASSAAVPSRHVPVLLPALSPRRRRPPGPACPLTGRAEGPRAGPGGPRAPGGRD